MVDKSQYFEANASAGGYYKSGNYEEESVLTPDYHGKIARGEELPNNPYLFRRWDISSAYAYTYNGWRSDFHAHSYPSWPWAIFEPGDAPMFGPNPMTRTGSLDSLKAEADAKLRLRLNDTELDLGVMVAELPETIGFVAQSMGRLVKGYRHLRRGKISAGLNALLGQKLKHKKGELHKIPDVAADKWLEYSYAVRPMVNDIYSLVDYFDKARNGYSKTFVVKGKAKQDWYASGDTGDTNSDPNNYHQMWVRCEGSAFCESSARVKVTNPTLYKLHQMGITNPALIAWELVPFSFVVDWLIPVGDYLKQWATPPGTEFLDGYRYVKYRTSTTGESDIGGSAYSTEWHTSRSGECSKKHREVLTNYPRPRLRRMSNKNLFEKLGSAMALLYKVRS